MFDAIGTYLTGSYNNAAVRGPDGTPGRTTSALIITDPLFNPKRGNAAGPGSLREQRLHNCRVPHAQARRGRKGVGGVLHIEVLVVARASHAYARDGRDDAAVDGAPV